MPLSEKYMGEQFYKHCYEEIWAYTTGIFYAHTASKDHCNDFVVSDYIKEMSEKRHPLYIYI